MSVTFHETEADALAACAANTRPPSGPLYAVAIFAPMEGSFDLCRFPRGGLLAVTEEQAGRLSAWPASTVSVVPIEQFGRVRLHLGTGHDGRARLVGHHLTSCLS